MPLLTRAVPWPLSALSGACQARAVGSDRRARWRGERGGQVGEAAGTRPASLTSAGGGRWPRRSGPAPAVSRREPLARPPVTRVAGRGPAQCPRNVCRGQPASRRPRLSGLLTALGLEVSMGECWGGRTLLPRGPSRGLWLSPAGEQCLPRKWRSRGDGGARARERGPGRGEACGGCSSRVSLRAALLLGPPVSDLTPRLGLGAGRGGGRQRGGAHAVPASASAQWQAGGRGAPSIPGVPWARGRGALEDWRTLSPSGCGPASWFFLPGEVAARTARGAPKGGPPRLPSLAQGQLGAEPAVLAVVLSHLPGACRLRVGAAPWAVHPRVTQSSSQPRGVWAPGMAGPISLSTGAPPSRRMPPPRLGAPWHSVASSHTAWALGA